MNKSDIIATVAADAGISKKAAKRAVDNTFATIYNAVVTGEKVAISGFGTFAAKERAARTGRNPLTGETLEIPARTVPAFKASKEFKDALK